MTFFLTWISEFQNTLDHLYNFVFYYRYIVDQKFNEFNFIKLYLPASFVIEMSYLMSIETFSYMCELKEGDEKKNEQMNC